MLNMNQRIAIEVKFQQADQEAARNEIREIYYWDYHNNGDRPGTLESGLSYPEVMRREINFNLRSIQHASFVRNAIIERNIDDHSNDEELVAYYEYLYA